MLWHLDLRSGDFVRILAKKRYKPLYVKDLFSLDGVKWRLRW